MNKFLACLVVLICLGRSGSAAAISNSVTVTATVLPERYIYVDQAGKVTKVVGNTAQAVTPTVVESWAPDTTIKMNAQIYKQYHELQLQNGGFAAGRSYYPPSALRAAIKHTPIYISKIF